MPIYEYCCRECGEKVEVLHRRRNEPAPACKKCGEDALERLISRTHFQLKGDGWYVTDYANKGSRGGDSGSGSDSGGDSGGDSGEDSGGASDSGGGESSGGTDSTSSTSSGASTTSSADSGA